MPSTNEDIALTFDATPFTEGFKAVEKKFDALTGIAAKTGKAITASILKAAVVITIAGTAIKGLIGAIKKHMPEVGATFTAAANIFWNNFLFPLRQALLPLLQRFMNWVREHRALFVQWGQTLVAVFRVLWQVASTAVNIIRTLVNTLFPNFASAMKHGFLDVINIFLFKVSFLVEAVSMMVQHGLAQWGPAIRAVLDGLLRVVVAVGKIAWSLLTGFFDSIMKNGPAIRDAFRQIGLALETFGKALGGIGKGNGILNLGKVLGQAFSSGLIAAMNSVALALTIIADAIGFLTGQHPNWSNLLGPLKGIAGAAKTMPGIGSLVGMGEGAVKSLGHIKGEKTKVDMGKWLDNWLGVFGIHRHTAQLAPPTPAPIQLQAPPGSKVPPPINSHHTVDVHLNVTAGDAKTAGQQFGDAFAYHFKNQILNENVRSGQ